VQVKLGTCQQDTHHVTADVIKDVRAKLRPLGGHVGDVTQMEVLEHDKVNARARRLDRRQLRRSFTTAAVCLSVCLSVSITKA